MPVHTLISLHTLHLPTLLSRPPLTLHPKHPPHTFHHHQQHPPPQHNTPHHSTLPADCSLVNPSIHVTDSTCPPQSNSFPVSSSLLTRCCRPSSSQSSRRVCLLRFTFPCPPHTVPFPLPEMIKSVVHEFTCHSWPSVRVGEYITMKHQQHFLVHAN